MAGNIVHVGEGALGLMPAPWVAVRRATDEYRVMVNDPRNPNSVTLSQRFDSLWSPLLSAREHAKRFGVPIHAIGYDDA